MRYRTRPKFVDAQRFHALGDHPRVEATTETATGFGLRVGAGWNAVTPGDWVLYHHDQGYWSALPPDLFSQRYELDTVTTEA